MNLKERIKFLEEALTIDPTFDESLKSELEDYFQADVSKWKEYFEDNPNSEFGVFNFSLFYGKLIGVGYNADVIYNYDNITAILPKKLVEYTPYFKNSLSFPNLEEYRKYVDSMSWYDKGSFESWMKIRSGSNKEIETYRVRQNAKEILDDLVTLGSGIILDSTSYQYIEGIVYETDIYNEYRLGEFKKLENGEVKFVIPGKMLEKEVMEVAQRKYDKIKLIRVRKED